MLSSARARLPCVKPLTVWVTTTPQVKRGRRSTLLSCSQDLHFRCFKCCIACIQFVLHCAEASFAYLQHAREEEIAERKAMKRAERDIARKKEYVRRVRLQIEEKRAEVSFGMHQYHVLLRTPLNYLCCGHRCCTLDRREGIVYGNQH